MEALMKFLLALSCIFFFQFLFADLFLKYFFPMKDWKV